MFKRVQIDFPESRGAASTAGGCARRCRGIDRCRNGGFDVVRAFAVVNGPDREQASTMRKGLTLLGAIAAVAAVPAFAQRTAAPLARDRRTACAVRACYRAKPGRADVDFPRGIAGPDDGAGHDRHRRALRFRSGYRRRALGGLKRAGAVARARAGPRVRLFDFTGATMTNSVAVPTMTVSRLASGMMTAPSLALADIGAAGMLGIDALQGHKMVIDFPRNRMMLTPARRHAQGDVVIRAAPGDRPVDTVEGELQRPADRGGDRYGDRGSASVIRRCSRSPAADRAVFARSRSFRSRAARFAADLVTVDGLDIGGVRFGNFGLAFADVPPFERFGLAKVPALILGMSSLKLFRRVELDFLNREVALTMPVPHLDFNDIWKIPPRPAGVIDMGIAKRPERAASIT